MDNQSGAIKNVYLHEDGKAVTIIDQTKLPTVTEYLTLGTAKDLYDAIFELKVRGAPAIGICAAFGMYVLAGTIETGDYDEFLKKFREYKDYLNSSRPTAVNLSWALKPHGAGSDKSQRCLYQRFLDI